MGPADSAATWTAQQRELLLSTLRWNWGDAYEITVTDDGRWAARRRDDSRVLRRKGPEELRQAIFNDYTVKPVPRDLPEGG